MAGLSWCKVYKGFRVQGTGVGLCPCNRPRGAYIDVGGGGGGEGEDLVQRFPDFFFVIKAEYLVIIFSVL